MAYKRFDVLEDLASRRVRLNIPLFLLASLSLNRERAALSMARPSLDRSVVNHSCRHSLSHSACSAYPAILPTDHSIAISVVHMATQRTCSSIVKNILINAHALLAVNFNYLFNSDK